MSLTTKIEALREALPSLTPERLSMAAEIVLSELEQLSARERQGYKDDIASLISALEAAILGLEQEAKARDS